MQITDTDIDGVLIIEPTVFEDDRGFFLESFNKAQFEEATGVVREWVQDNHSGSTRGVIRGLHFQNPSPQGKLITCSLGTIWDVAVDLRVSSDTFGRWVGIELSSESHRQVWIPEGLAHGFLTLSESAEVMYKTTAFYEPSCDRSLRWNDPDLGIEWPITGDPLLSAKDREAPLLGEIDLCT